MSESRREYKLHGGGRSGLIKLRGCGRAGRPNNNPMDERAGRGLIRTGSGGAKNSAGRNGTGKSFR